ncbi:hypothetical protein AGABI2DRAFT_195380 [Agaricus bisporus var. bisporus H97]|uniref:hypothetical protein n=1 Tax=Agaricus bisporus var. bisporus (strain H97 / ATCC MYA-4626 / FGSC 10389) TaxID=936046 RepID=UPI00029F5181|nr:hypothetical protein AGABI2DRAFT_195380 [Agaricus bisporus var. bisporus H97]EKV43155.1 hypothetical protein AGABI2DRAFT_195380 [Agaricus bisporus var. bisporus H97]
MAATTSPSHTRNNKQPNHDHPSRRPLHCGILPIAFNGEDDVSSVLAQTDAGNLKADPAIPKSIVTTRTSQTIAEHGTSYSTVDTPCSRTWIWWELCTVAEWAGRLP